MFAARVVPRPVLLPLDPLEERVVGREDPVGEQVARALPAVGVARDRAPRRAGQLAVAGEEVLVDRAREPAVVVLARGGANGAELLLVLGPRHRQVRVDLRVLVARRDEHPVDPDLVREVIHHLDDVLDLGLLEDRRVRRHPETARPRLHDRADRDVPEARVVADVVVDLAHAVEVDDEGQPLVRLEDVHELLEPQRVGAELDVLVQLHEARDDVLDPLEDERLAAADRDHRGRALHARVDALLDRQLRLVRLVLADLPAADAGDVARERRLEHQHERVALAAALVARDVAGDLNCRSEGKFHLANLSRRRPSASNGKCRR